MAVTINAKGTTVPYFKIGKTGVTLYQGSSDPSGSYTVTENDVWFDTGNQTIKYFNASASWDQVQGTGGGSTAWGDLTGNIADQTDLQTTLGDYALVRDMKLENGYNDRSATLVTFTEATRTFTIEPASGHTYFEVWSEGVYHKITTQKSIQIPDTEGSHYIYFDGSGNLAQTTTYDSHDLLARYAYTSAIYWDADNKKVVYFGNEQHGRADLEMHEYLHDCVGTQWVSGLALSNMTVGGDGSSDTHAQIGITDGKIRDEDIGHIITNGSPQTLSSVAQIPLYYRTGTAGHWRKIDATGFVAHPVGSGRPAWNEWTGTTWQLTEVDNNDYVITHIFATGDRRHPIIGVIGQATYPTVSSAQSGATTEINQLSTGEMDEAFEEFKAIASVLLFTTNNYTNSVKASIEYVDTGVDYIDWRTVSGGNAGTLGIAVSDHGQMTGLEDDDHLQYHNDTRGDARYYTQTQLDSMIQHTESYSSGEIAITSGGLVQLTHGLNSTPESFTFLLKCVTAEANYSVGDELVINHSESVSAIISSTNIDLRYNSATSVFSVPNKTSGTLTALTNANWKLIVKAWA